MADVLEGELTKQQLNLLKVLKKEGYQTISELHAATEVPHSEIKKDMTHLMSLGLVFNIYKMHAFSLYLYRGYVEDMLEKADEVNLVSGEIETVEAKNAIRSVMPQARVSTSGRPLAKETLALPLDVPFMTINHQVGWNRVIVLKRIRDRLMEEYHPVLNAVIGDYEQMLKLWEE